MDEEYGIESILQNIVQREVQKEVDRLAAMEKVPFYLPGTPGATGPRGADGKNCDEERLDGIVDRLDDLGRRLRALEKGGQV